MGFQMPNFDGSGMGGDDDDDDDLEAELQRLQQGTGGGHGSNTNKRKTGLFLCRKKEIILINDFIHIYNQVEMHKIYKHFIVM